jgi:hypothetical protein
MRVVAVSPGGEEQVRVMPLDPCRGVYYACDASATQLAQELTGSGTYSQIWLPREEACPT